MQLRLANHSSYPAGDKVPDAQGPQSTGGPTPAGAAPPITDSQLEDIVRDQEACGLDLVTDGQAHWTDPVSHYLSRLRGVRWNGTTCFLEAGKPIRRPVVEAKLRRRDLELTSEYQRVCLIAHAAVKVVVTGPYSLAKLATVETTAYRSTADLAMDLSSFLAEEVASLAAVGATYIQIDEPLILRHPGEFRLLRQVLEPLQDASGDHTQLAVATYGADAASLYAQLNSLPADILALDLAGHDLLQEAVRSTGSGKPLAFGLIDARDDRIEDPEAVARRLEMLLHRYVHEDAQLQTSCGLANLSRRSARAKLELLASVRNRLNGTKSEAPR